MARTGKSGWFRKRSSAATTFNRRLKSSVKCRRRFTNARGVESLEIRLLLAATGSPIALDSLDGSNGFRIASGSEDGVLGDDVQNVGDMNGDGYDDLLITSPVDEDRGQGRGQAYVIFGAATGFPTVLNPSADLDGTNGFVITAESANDFVVGRVDTVGDCIADGFADLIVLSENDSSTFNDAQIILGHAGSFPSRLDARQL
ncbi:MAG: FG-GAP repeat protein, partial [Rhodopirellula sp.]|nr:FG-GAP repeat protein [Rhodopirellula sp.]